jgi:hypothetical protein
MNCAQCLVQRKSIWFQPCRSVFACFTPALPLLVWVLLHLSSSILTSCLTARSELARYNPSLPCTLPDLSQLGMIRVRVIPGPIRVCSFLIQVMIQVTWPDPSQQWSAFQTQYVPATVASGRRPHYRKGVRCYRAMARRRQQAGARGALHHGGPRGAAMMCGFNFSGWPLVVHDWARARPARAVLPKSVSVERFES